jgi:hypothetical protein
VVDVRFAFNPAALATKAPSEVAAGVADFLDAYMADAYTTESPCSSVGAQAPAETERWRALAMDYAVACGELSKGLTADSPMWTDLQALGARLDAVPEGQG